ncbi:hypothetical protein DDQ50_08805 [Amnibacterium flavum]|uniref:histidine kinase n=2 Tax=Amnibacterium flavum TaxID=2173173 RepID=A0A2V1HWJ3_9MICO|nr:hypothetical protein DDQ50_08805 [Amnibacterium flavum]
MSVAAEPGVALPLTAQAVVSVVGNLLDNAIEAALRGEADRSVHFGLRDDGGRVALTVSDSGPGRGVSDQADWFERGATTKAGEPGAHGIGLAVVATLLSDRGATVALDDTGPTTVTVTFPAGAGGIR